MFCTSYYFVDYLPILKNQTLINNYLDFILLKIVVVIVNYSVINFDIGEVRIYIKEYEYWLKTGIFCILFRLQVKSSE